MVTFTFQDVLINLSAFISLNPCFCSLQCGPHAALASVFPSRSIIRSINYDLDDTFVGLAASLENSHVEEVFFVNVSVKPEA